MQRVLDHVFNWGYMLDQVPAMVPFISGPATCSLETAADYLGAKNIIYMNSMYGRVELQERRKNPDPASLAMYEHLAENWLSDRHFRRLAKYDTVICALEHHNYLESAAAISRLSLQYRNIKGVLFDDFKVPLMPYTELSPAQLADIYAATKNANPDLKLYLVSFDYQDLKDYEPYLDYFDVMTRWSWIQDPLYYEYYWRDHRRLRNVCQGKQLLQGIYFANTGRDGGFVNLDFFQLSIKALADYVAWDKLDGLIIPSPGYFGRENLREHVQWLKNYLQWRHETTTVLPPDEQPAGQVP